MEYRIGELVSGVVTGVQPYGAFVQIDYDNSGLVHISEISDRFVKDVASFVQVGEVIKVKIIDKEEDGSHYKLSLKAANKTSSRVREAYMMKDNLPPSLLGFQTIAEHLDEWIEKAK